MTIERITIDDVPNQLGHVYRYELAAQWLVPGDTVIDVACGIGYGAEILQENVAIQYLGVDKIKPDIAFTTFGDFESGVDLMAWEPKIEFDVALCFETLEHLVDPSKLVNELKKSRRLIIISVPTRPTKHFNKFHLHDFLVDDIIKMFDDWELVYLEDQPSELSHIFVFGRHDVA